MFGEWVGFEVVREPLYDPARRADPGVSDATGSAATGRPRCGAGTDAELRGWLDVALAACDEADAIARRTSGATWTSRPSPTARS